MHLQPLLPDSHRQVPPHNPVLSLWQVQLHSRALPLHHSLLVVRHLSRQGAQLLNQAFSLRASPPVNHRERQRASPRCNPRVTRPQTAPQLSRLLPLRTSRPPNLRGSRVAGRRRILRASPLVSRHRGPASARHPHRVAVRLRSRVLSHPARQRTNLVRTRVVSPPDSQRPIRQSALRLSPLEVLLRSPHSGPPATPPGSLAEFLQSRRQVPRRAFRQANLQDYRQHNRPITLPRNPRRRRLASRAACQARVRPGSRRSPPRLNRPVRPAASRLEARVRDPRLSPADSRLCNRVLRLLPSRPRVRRLDPQGAHRWRLRLSPAPSRQAPRRNNLRRNRPVTLLPTGQPASHPRFRLGNPVVYRQGSPQHGQLASRACNPPHPPLCDLPTDPPVNLLYRRLRSQALHPLVNQVGRRLASHRSNQPPCHRQVRPRLQQRNRIAVLLPNLRLRRVGNRLASPLIAQRERQVLSLLTSRAQLQQVSPRRSLQASRPLSLLFGQALNRPARQVRSPRYIHQDSLQVDPPVNLVVSRVRGPAPCQRRRPQGNQAVSPREFQLASPY